MRRETQTHAVQKCNRRREKVQIHMKQKREQKFLKEIVRYEIGEKRQDKIEKRVQVICKIIEEKGEAKYISRVESSIKRIYLQIIYT